MKRAKALQVLKLKKTNAEGLIIENDEDKKCRDVIRLVMALPLASDTDIPIGWGEIKKDITDDNLTARFSKFIAYFERQWLERQPPEHWSVWQDIHRTNNLSESYNSRLSTSLGTHAVPWTWMSNIGITNFHL